MLVSSSIHFLEFEIDDWLCMDHRSEEIIISALCTECFLTSNNNCYFQLSITMYLLIPNFSLPWVRDLIRVQQFVFKKSALKIIFFNRRLSSYKQRNYVVYRENVLEFCVKMLISEKKILTRRSFKYTQDVLVAPSWLHQSHADIVSSLQCCGAISADVYNMVQLYSLQALPDVNTIIFLRYITRIINV